MGRQERKAKRAARKTERKAARQNRSQKKAEFINALQTAEIDVDLDSQPEFVDVFNQFWPISRKALEFAISLRITKDKADEAIAVVIDIGDRIATGNASEEEQTEFTQKLEVAWAFIGMGLEFAQMLTPDEADEVIDKILEIGDWILEDDDDD